MPTLPSFEELLPKQTDPAKAAMREKLVGILSSKGEILPSANSPRGKLWRLVNSPGSSLEECAEVIQLDTALASRIFRIANSGAYAAQAGNISEAILCLGLKFVREQVFNAAVFKEYSGWVLPSEWDLFWLRNIFVARLCERMSAAYGSTNGSEYLAGLVHDMGWLFLATYLPDEFTQMFGSGKTVAEAEQEFLPFGHAQISAAIAARTLLPPRAIHAILHHHDPLSATFADQKEPNPQPNKLGVILKVCDNVADICQMDMFGRATVTIESLPQSPEVLWLNRFGNTHDFVTLAEEELAKSQDIFSVYFSNRKFQ